jgi:two-component system NarL family sensor kinase
VSQDVVAAGEKERTRIARELHDGVCQMLAVSKHSLERAFESADACNPRHTQHLRAGLGNLEECIREIRRISHGLKTVLPADQPLAEALSKLVREFAERTQVGLQVDGLDTANSDRLSPSSQHALYRTAQEALMNIEKHAKASQIALALTDEEEEGQVTLAILDNGCGIRRPEGCGHAGIGMSNMRERVKEVGGALTLQSSTAGTAVIARVPANWRSGDKIGLSEASTSDLRQVGLLRRRHTGPILTQVGS